jgi:hypothetical protein
MTWIAPEVSDQPTAGVGSERELLDTWLDAHRRTLRWKCSGLAADQLKMTASPPSSLTLLGLVRHMADNERWWFSHQAAGLPLVELYGTEADPDGDFRGVPEADPAVDLATFEAEVVASRVATAGIALDREISGQTGRRLSVRWVFLHMIEEYARHNGHADLLRERIDGRRGDFAHRDS